jgi:hypothetical protein
MRCIFGVGESQAGVESIASGDGALGLKWEGTPLEIRFMDTAKFHFF